MTNDSNINLAEKFKALSIGERIIVVAGPVLFIIGFFHWYSYDFGCSTVLTQQLCPSIGRSAWESPGAIWSIFAILIGLAMSAVVAVRSLTTGVIPDNVSGFSWPKIQLGAGSVAALFIVIKLLNHSSNLSIGFFLGIVAVGALVAGGALMYRDEKSASS